MSTAKYLINSDAAEITVAVNATIIGNCTTRIKQRLSDGTSRPVIPKGQSSYNDDGTGDVAECSLGPASECKGSIIVINTLVNLVGIPDHKRDYVYKYAKEEYEMDGGAISPEQFNYDEDDKMWIEEKNIFLITKAIKIISNAL